MWIICFQPQKGKYRVSLQKECHDLAVGKMHVRRSSVQASCTQWVQINYEVAGFLCLNLIYSEKATRFEKIHFGFNVTNALGSSSIWTCRILNTIHATS